MVAIGGSVIESSWASGENARKDGFNLRHRALNSLRAAVVTGELASGGIYSVPALANSFGVSLTPVREAMLDLVHDGLAEPVPNRGFRIIEVSSADLDEIFELRLLLEVSSMVKLAGQRVAVDVAQFQDIVNVIEAAAAQGDLVAFLGADRDFHLSLLGLLQNQRLVKIVDMLRLQSRLPGLGDLASSALRSSAAEHQHILDAIVAHDRLSVRRLMVSHLRHTRGVWAGLKE